MNTRCLILLMCVLCPAPGRAQNATQTSEQGDPPEHYLASSLFVLVSLMSEESADFAQLTYGHHLTARDIVLVEATTWKYSEPLGTYGSADEDYPGKIRSWGAGVGYQRFHWRKAYTTVQATGFLQQFYDEDDAKIQKGFQLYCQVIAGYRLDFFDRRLFIEPGLAFKFWPVDTNFPDSFDTVREGTNSYIFEPSLHIGVNF